jgi:hypothetical protein
MGASRLVVLTNDNGWINNDRNVNDNTFRIWERVRLPMAEYSTNIQI